MIKININLLKKIKVFEFENGGHTVHLKNLNEIKSIIDQMVLNS